MYQYILNFEDSMMEEYLKKFTFLTKEEIEDIMKQQEETPEKRIAQKRLAKEVLDFIHGDGAYENAVKISESLFSGNIRDLTSEQIEVAFKGVEPFVAKDANLVDFLVDFGICSSKREAREFISNGSISVNGDRVTDLDYQVTKNDSIEQKYVVIRRGKKKYFIGKFQ